MSGAARLDEMLRALDFLNENNMKLKMHNAKAETFASQIAVKTPCLPRSEAWFEQHKLALYEATAREYTGHIHGDAPDTWSLIRNIPEEPRVILFNRVAKRYREIAESGKLIMTITQGCCTNKTCSFIRFQHAALMVIRQFVRQDEKEKEAPAHPL